jgi:outer membrane protein assembly factor BamB
MNVTSAPLTLFVTLILLVTSAQIGLEASDQIDADMHSQHAPWPMHGGNPQHTGLSSYSISGNLGEVEKKIGGYHFSGTPVIAENGTIYVSTTSCGVYCLDPSGEILCKFETAAPVKGSPALSSDGTLYVATYTDGYFNNEYSNYLYSIEMNGSVNWMRPLDGFGCQFGPCVTDDGRIYVGTTQGNLSAFNEDGEMLWSYNAEDDIRCSPAVDHNGSVYFSCFGGYIYSLSRDGELRWKFPVAGPQWSTPTIGNDGTVYYGAEDGKLYAISSNGSERWNYTTGGSIRYGVAIGPDNSIYVQSGVKLQKIADNGSLIWETGGDFDATFNQAPTVDRDGTVIIERGVETSQGIMYNLEAYTADGNLKWSMRFDGAGDEEQPFSASISESGKVLVINEGQYLYIVGDAVDEQFYLVTMGAIVLVAAAFIIFILWYDKRRRK